MKRIKTLLVAIGIVATALLAAVPAGATTAGPACRMQISQTHWGAGVLNLRSCDAYDYADWDFDGIPDELFAVRNDRTIWHAWSGSHGWRLMPGNKTADDMNNLAVDKQNSWWLSGEEFHIRNISVWAAGGTGYWCTSGVAGIGWFGEWRDC